MAKYTNNYTILKDILKSEYTFILTLLFNNFDDIIHLLKEKRPFYGEVLEYLYLSLPEYYNNKHDLICNQFRYIDDVLRIIYKTRKKYNCIEFKRDVHIICKDFHINEQEFEYYYFIALVILSLESTINEDAINLYSQLDDHIVENVTDFLQELFNTLTRKEFQCIFYNHLEDVYHTNRSDDGKISVLYKKNYSYFLDNFDIDIMFKKIDSYKDDKVPIIITKENIYNIIDNKVNHLSDNTIDKPIFHDNVIYVAYYYIKEHKIKNFIPFFNYFYNEYKDLNNDICYPLYNEYEIDYTFNNDMIDIINKSNSFSIFDENLNDLHYYIDQFTIYTNITEEENKEENNIE